MDTNPTTQQGDAVQLIQEIASGQRDADLHDLALAIKARRSIIVQQADAVKMPTHVVASDVRPRYLAGTKGRVGGWTSDNRGPSGRRKFYPVVGSEAYARNRVWRVTSASLIALEVA
jgi:hypothetical protein